MQTRIGVRVYVFAIRKSKKSYSGVDGIFHFNSPADSVTFGSSETLMVVAFLTCMCVSGPVFR